MVPGRQHIWLRLIKCLWGAMLLVLAPHGHVAAGDSGPREVVAGLNAALLESMQNAGALGYAGRYQLLEPVLARSFNFPFMTKIAVGRAWTDFTVEERERIIDLFAEMSTANFAARFDGYSGERFEIVAKGSGPRDSVVIESEIVRPADPPVGLNYVLKLFDDDWRIIDVLLDAKYSELARQRSEFSAVLKSGGLPDLIASLERKINQLAGNS